MYACHLTKDICKQIKNNLGKKVSFSPLLSHTRTFVLKIILWEMSSYSINNTLRFSLLHFMLFLLCLANNTLNFLILIKL